jgi:hypothetical protein
MLSSVMEHNDSLTNLYEPAAGPPSEPVVSSPHTHTHTRRFRNIYFNAVAVTHAAHSLQVLGLTLRVYDTL